MRSRSAATLLVDAGIREVYSMEGGIKAWQGGVATGDPASAMAHFSPAASIEELVALAWGLEEGSRRFYREAAETFVADGEAASLLEQLAGDEIRHQGQLLQAYRQVAGRELDPEPFGRKFPQAMAGDTMEGGIAVAAAISWSKERTVAELLQLAMAMEANALDLYVKMGREAAAEARELFLLLSAEEHSHLRRLGRLLDNRL